MKCVWDTGAELGEGAVWHPNEDLLYWVDIFKSQLHRYSLTGEKRSWSFPGSISAVAPAQNGGLLATFQFGLAHIDVDDEQVTPLIQLETDLVDNRFNDGCCDCQGNFWFGSMDIKQLSKSGAFYRLGSDGIVQKIPQLDQICITNGPTFSKDGGWVFYTDTAEGKIYRARIKVDGSLEDHALHIQYGPDDGYPDGMCTDLEGGLWVCHWGAARVSRFHEDGQLDQAFDVPAPNVTKCAFGGSDMRTLFITTATAGMSESDLESHPQAGGLFAMETKHQGFSYPAATYPPVLK